MYEDHDRCFSTLILGAFPQVFLSPMQYPKLTPTRGANRVSRQVFINAIDRLLYTSDGVWSMSSSRLQGQVRFWGDSSSLRSGIEFGQSMTGWGWE